MLLRSIVRRCLFLIIRGVIHATHRDCDHARKANDHSDYLDQKDRFTENEVCQDACPESTKLEDYDLESKWNQLETHIENEKAELARQTSPEKCVLLIPWKLFHRIPLD